MMAESPQEHWEKVYSTKSAREVSWFEARPTKSLDLIRASGVAATDPIIDVGGGASFLVDELLSAGFQDITVLDVSATVLRSVGARLGPRGVSVTLLQQDVTTFRPSRRYALWHDRAVFHFLTEPNDRARYLDVFRRALLPEGQVVIATFGPSGPQRCSGLPVRRYDEAALAAELGSDWKLLESSLAVHSTPWGAEQQFLYCRFGRRA